MSTPNNVAVLLQKGIEAAREGKRSEAHDLFQQVIEIDEKNEKGWFWLASVVETDEERIICLGNVLHINPNNERAKRALDTLQAKAKEKKTTSDAVEAEVIPGVSRRRVRDCPWNLAEESASLSVHRRSTGRKPHHSLQAG